MIQCIKTQTLKSSDYMTHTEYTKLILTIKDENIHFYENYLEIANINDSQTKIFHGYLNKSLL